MEFLGCRIHVARLQKFNGALASRGPCWCVAVQRFQAPTTRRKPHRAAIFKSGVAIRAENSR